MHSEWATAGIIGRHSKTPGTPRSAGYRPAIPRFLRIAVLVVVLLTIVSVILAVPDLGTLVVEKVTEGGMWTGLAVFLVAANILVAAPVR